MDRGATTRLVGLELLVDVRLVAGLVVVVARRVVVAALLQLLQQRGVGRHRRLVVGERRALVVDDLPLIVLLLHLRVVARLEVGVVAVLGRLGLGGRLVARRGDLADELRVGRREEAVVVEGRALVVDDRALVVLLRRLGLVGLRRLVVVARRGVVGGLRRA